LLTWDIFIWGENEKEKRDRKMSKKKKCCTEKVNNIFPRVGE